jgi:hypothetical protein
VNWQPISELPLIVSMIDEASLFSVTRSIVPFVLQLGASRP